MLKIITVDDIKNLIQQLGFNNCMRQLVEAMRADYQRWQEFEKFPRFASYSQQGVIELMPVSDQDYFAVKYVNGHPKNPSLNKPTVVAIGLLSDVATGYPLLISEMTLLTAIRTAATSVLAASYLAKKNSTALGIIGTGGQSEFQVLAHSEILPIKQVKYFDIDAQAMKKFENNLQPYGFELIPCKDAYTTTIGVDVIITSTADKKRSKILHNDWIKDGVHINALGGDCPGKTELDPAILNRSKVVVEYLEQSKVEGEIQNLDSPEIYAELWEIVSGDKPGRESDQEVTLFDSVGFAVADYSALRYLYHITEQLGIGHTLDLIPEVEDPKDLFGGLYP